jgi:hypothetical protein
MIKKGKYYLMKFSTTHDQFLFRNYEKEGLNNDLLFENVSFMSISPSVELLELKVEKIKVGNRHEFKVNLKHKEGIYYVHCFKLRYQQNNLDSSKSSIPSDLTEPATTTEILKIVKEIEEDGYDKVSKKLSSRWNWTTIETDPLMID